MRSRLFPYLLIAPATILMVAVMGYPLLKSAHWSFLHYLFTDPQSYFTGLSNYARVLQDDRFWRVVYNTFRFTFFSLVISYLIALATALLLNLSLRGRAILRALVLLPWVVPPIVAGLIWSTFYDPTIGLFNHISTYFGLGRVMWLSDPGLALWSVMGIIIWKGTPFMIVALLAGLQSIPDELYEAAKIDGASAWHRFRFITMPLLMPVTSVVLILNAVWRFNHFDLVWMLTGGGPGYSTHLISSWSFLATFGELNPGVGSAIAMMGVSFSAIFVILALRAFGGERIR
jgi:multiple sugar transport system permease protein